MWQLTTVQNCTYTFVHLSRASMTREKKHQTKINDRLNSKSLQVWVKKIICVCASSTFLSCLSWKWFNSAHVYDTQNRSPIFVSDAKRTSATQCLHCAYFFYINNWTLQSDEILKMIVWHFGISKRFFWAQSHFQWIFCCDDSFIHIFELYFFSSSNTL